jgi:prevent-host-death family protein
MQLHVADQAQRGDRWFLLPAAIALASRLYSIAVLLVLGGRRRRGSPPLRSGRTRLLRRQPPASFREVPILRKLDAHSIAPPSAVVAYHRPSRTSPDQNETTMKQVGVYEAKTRLPQLLDEVERGESITITRNGRPVARLVPLAGRGLNVEQAIEALEELRRTHSLGDVSLTELIGSGRI